MITGSKKIQYFNDVRGIYGGIPNEFNKFDEITNTWRDVKRGESINQIYNCNIISKIYSLIHKHQFYKLLI